MKRLFFFIIFLLSIASAFSFTPQDDMNLRNEYAIWNATNITAGNITADYLIGDGSGITGISGTVDATDNYSYLTSNVLWFNTSFILLNLGVNDSNYSTYSGTATTWDSETSQADLNVNLSDFWDSYNTSEDITYLGSLLDAVITYLNSTLGRITDIVSTTINSTYFYQGGNLVLDSGDESTLNVNSSTFWDSEENQSDLNVNSSNYWDSLDSPTDITQVGTLADLTISNDFNANSQDIDNISEITNYYSVACTYGVIDVQDDGTLICYSPAITNTSNLATLSLVTTVTQLNASILNVSTINQFFDSDCAANNYVYGINTDGSLDCRADENDGGEKIAWTNDSAMTWTSHAVNITDELNASIILIDSAVSGYPFTLINSLDNKIFRLYDSASHHGRAYIYNSSGNTKVRLASDVDSYILTELGINTTSPDDALDVDGNVGITGDLELTGSSEITGYYGAACSFAMKDVADDGTFTCQQETIDSWSNDSTTVWTSHNANISSDFNLTGNFNLYNSTFDRVTHFSDDGSDNYVLNGQFGLGMDSPTYNLDIKQDTENTIALAIRNTNDVVVYKMYTTADGDSYLLLSNATGSNMILFNGNNGQNSYINSGGNFGIGTTSPTQLLHLKSTAATAQIYVDVNAGDSSSDAAIILNSDDDQFIYLQRDESTKWTILNDRGAGDDLYIKNSNNTITFSMQPSGDLWVVGDMSALSFTDRTPMFEGDALSAISKIKSINGKIDHPSLPEFVKANYTIPIYSKKYFNNETNTTEKDIIGYEEKEGRDLGASISLNWVAIQQLEERIKRLESELNLQPIEPKKELLTPTTGGIGAVIASLIAGGYALYKHKPSDPEPNYKTKGSPLLLMYGVRLSGTGKTCYPNLDNNVGGKYNQYGWEAIL